MRSIVIYSFQRGINNLKISFGRFKWRTILQKERFREATKWFQVGHTVVLEDSKFSNNLKDFSWLLIYSPPGPIAYSNFGLLEGAKYTECQQTIILFLKCIVRYFWNQELIRKQGKKIGRLIVLECWWRLRHRVDGGVGGEKVNYLLLPVFLLYILQMLRTGWGAEDAKRENNGFHCSVWVKC